MAKNPNLDSISKRMEKGESFTFTRAQYIRETGADIPQNKSYTEKRSAVARKAREKGYKVEVIPEIIKFIKI